MKWLKALIRKFLALSTNETIENVIIWYDDVDVILFKKPGEK